VSSASRRACRAVLFDKLDTAKMHGLDRRQLNTFLFAQRIERIRDITTMRYIYLLTYLLAQWHEKRTESKFKGVGQADGVWTAGLSLHVTSSVHVFRLVSIQAVSRRSANSHRDRNPSTTPSQSTIAARPRLRHRFVAIHIASHLASKDLRNSLYVSASYSRGRRKTASTWSKVSRDYSIPKWDGDHVLSGGRARRRCAVRPCHVINIKFSGARAQCLLGLQWLATERRIVSVWSIVV